MTRSLRMQAVMATLAGLTAPYQALVEGLERGVAADGGQGRHVQRGADAGAAAHDHAAAAEGAAVAVDRRHADQGRDLAAIEGAELGQLGDERTGRGLADAGDTEASRSSVARQAGVPRMASSRSVSSAASSCCSHARCASKTSDQAGVTELAATLALARDHLDQLAQAGRPARRALGRRRSAPVAAPAAPLRQSGRWPRHRGGRSWPDVRWPERSRGSGVGLTTTRGSPAAASALATCDLEAPGRFQHHQRRREGAQAPDQRFEPRAVTAERKGLVRRAQVHVEAVLGDIDADEGRRSGEVLHDPSLRMRARPRPAPATVRVREPTGGRGAELTHGLVHPRGTRAPVRSQAPPAGRAWQLREQGGCTARAWQRLCRSRLAHSSKM